jgi:hypothetical protein
MDNLMLLKIGIFVGAFFVVAQFSFWGNYLPLVYPVHLRGTGEGFAANVGGRMFGTAANALTGLLLAPLFMSTMTGLSNPAALAYGSAATALIVILIAVVVTQFLPEPDPKAIHD